MAKPVSEILFVVEDAPEGGLTAAAVGFDIFTEADTIEELRARTVEAVLCHFESEEGRPRLIRLHRVIDEVIAVESAA